MENLRRRNQYIHPADVPRLRVRVPDKERRAEGQAVRDVQHAHGLRDHQRRAGHMLDCVGGEEDRTTTPRAREGSEAAGLHLPFQQHRRLHPVLPAWQWHYYLRVDVLCPLPFRATRVLLHHRNAAPNQLRPTAEQARRVA